MSAPALVTVPVSELTGVALNWAVDAAETGDPMRVEYKKDGSGVWMLFDKHNMYAPNGPQKYSSDWKLAGPIIDREKMDIASPRPAWKHWKASVPTWTGTAGAIIQTHEQYGPTPLIAAMRCYVASKLGETVQVPAELLS